MRGRTRDDGYRSGFEATIGKWLEDNGYKFTFETEQLEYFIKKPRAKCYSCGSVDILEQHWYTPDFIVEVDGHVVYLETKGKFTSKDRGKMLAIKEDHPELDVRMVFMRDNWLTKKKITKYSQWSENHDLNYIVGGLTHEWLKKMICSS